jgi:hypothetical protein
MDRCHYARKYMVPLEGQHFLCMCVDGTGERTGCHYARDDGTLGWAALMPDV